MDSTLIITLGLLLFAGIRSHWTGRLLVLLLLSPVLRYGLAIFGFTIRLSLSNWAGMLLRFGGLDVQTEGNVLVRQVPGIGPVEMAVDPACMGLHMTGLSVLVAVFWLMWHERQHTRRVSVGPLLAYGAVAFGLTILCNLIRIVVLVAFGLGPESPLHEGVGLVCVVVYAWLPAWWLARFTVNRFGQVVAENQAVRLGGSVGWGVATLTVGAGLMAFTARPAPTDNRTQQPLVQPFINQNFTIRTTTRDGFYQLTKPGLLLYLKPLPDWWSAEHSPAVCWRGGGYELRRVRVQPVGNKSVYTAQLKHKNRPTLYTAWWFTNGTNQTLGQLDFRWRMARGEPGFALVNITAEKPLAVHQLRAMLR